MLARLAGVSTLHVNRPLRIFRDFETALIRGLWLLKTHQETFEAKHRKLHVYFFPKSVATASKAFVVVKSCARRYLLYYGV